jgi:EAL domain-containing protein (putative c-di-GMP-specific phosphodiesterase class I)
MKRPWEDGLRLQYEPQIELTTGDLTGVEALVRWEHPARGLLSRETMVALADDTGLDIRLDRWIMAEASRQAGAWAGTEHRPHRVCVDLSARHLHHPDLVPALDRVLQQTGLEPARFVVGAKADAVVTDISATSPILTRLKELGVGLAIDDFGVRYASLSYLRHLPFDTIKINLSFLATTSAETGDQALFRAIVELAHALGMRVIVEGIETAAQLAYARVVGCDQGQGSYFSPPLSADEISEIAANGWSEYRLPPLEEPGIWTAPSAAIQRVSD